MSRVTIYLISMSHVIYGTILKKHTKKTYIALSVLRSRAIKLPVTEMPQDIPISSLI